MVRFGPPIEFVAGNPNLTFIFFIALFMLAVLGVRFTFYALRNRSVTEIDTQLPIWTYMTYVGGFATVYSLLGMLEIASSLNVQAKTGMMLAVTLVLAFAIRQIHRASHGDDRNIYPFEQGVRPLFVGLVVLTLALLAVFGESNVTAALQGLSALAFVSYGLVYYREQMAESRVQGTMLDSLLRHLLPVLTFAALVSVVALAIPAGLDRAIVLHVQVVFIIMTATALMTATIKLRQNLASL
jgi:hypothetical protein